MRFSREVLWGVIAVLAVVVAALSYKLVTGEGFRDRGGHVHSAHRQGMLVDAYHTGIDNAVRAGREHREHEPSGSNDDDDEHTRTDYSDAIPRRPRSTRGVVGSYHRS